MELKNERTASRCRRTLAAICAASLLSCHTPQGPAKPEAEDCQVKLSDEVEQRLRMRSGCWDEVPFLARSELSAMLETAAKGNTRAVAGIPRLNEPGRIIRTPEEALGFLRTEGRKEVWVLEFVRSVSEIDGSRQLEKLRPLYAGTDMEPLLEKFPPYAVEVHFNSGFGSEDENALAGKYFPGTNLWIINPAGALHNEASPEQVATHELLHYISWLGHGGIYYYLGSDSRGRFLAMDQSMWLEEGLASLISYRLSAEGWEKVPYPHFTASALVLEKIAGSRTITSALLSGDMRPVQERFESALEGLGFYETVTGNILLGPAYEPVMKARSDDFIFLSEVRAERIIRKICEAPPKHFDCSL